MGGIISGIISRMGIGRKKKLNQRIKKRNNILKSVGNLKQQPPNNSNQQNTQIVSQSGPANLQQQTTSVVSSQPRQ